MKYFQQRGYERNVVVLTQPKGYTKKTSVALDAVMRVVARKYPAIRHAMHVRADMYNEQLRFLKEQEREGNALVICPDMPLGISRLEKDPKRLQEIYDMGREKGLEMLPQVKAFLE